MLRIDILWYEQVVLVCMLLQKKLQERCGMYYEDVFVMFAHFEVSFGQSY